MSRPHSEAPEHPLVTSLRPLADALGAEIISPDQMNGDSIPVEWAGDVVAGFRMLSLHNALDRIVSQVEKELGSSLSDLSRVDKQVSVRVLDERGAFQLRRSIDDVADLMGVSRITVYNYLNSIRGDDPGA